MIALAIMQFVVAVAHGARIVVRDDDGRGRRFVAASACVLYTAVAMGCLHGDRWALWVGAAGPVVGLTAVLMARQRPDRWQLAVGVLQAAATLLSVAMLLGGVVHEA